MPRDDRDLITQAQAGNMEAFEELVCRYDRQVLDIAMNNEKMVLPKIVAMKIAMNRVSKAMRQRTSSMEQ